MNKEKLVLRMAFHLFSKHTMPSFDSLPFAPNQKHRRTHASIIIVAAFFVGYILAAAIIVNHDRHGAGLVGDADADAGSRWKIVAMYRNVPIDTKRDPLYGSQCGQDLTIADIFKHKRKGIFLDLASNDATALSNTVVLERKYGWDGLCVEPNVIYMRGYAQRTCRLVQAVVGPTDGVSVEFNFERKGLGGIIGFDNGPTNVTTEEHNTVSMVHLLRDFGMPRVIDYFSFDVEGAEAWAMETFPWDQYTFLVVTVERPNQELKTMLKRHGYTYVCYHGGFGDELWIHKSLPNYDEVYAKYGGRSECRNNERPCTA
jgi:hypothetical protein